MAAMYSSAGTAGLELTLPSEREVRIVRSFAAPRRLVFDAWTIPDHLRRWLAGMPGWSMTACEGDLRVGGATRLAWTGPGGESLEIRSVYREVDPPVRVVAVESWGGDWPETVNTLEFVEDGGRTTVTLTILYPSEEARDAAIRSGMAEGLSANFVHLDEHLRSIA